MTTHRGLGANTAFLDAVDLAKALQTVGDWREALSEYETKMFERGFQAAKESLQSTDSIHLSGWKAAMRDWMVWTIGWILWAKQKISP
jgi:2-polyprenyl-6-methoxyphenol hydroxylase-like FAD-dependent oxidoreductase